MKTDIIQKEDLLLRNTSKEVGIEDIKSRKIQTIIKRMQKALDNEEDGIAIAAPQIGENLRIFVVSKKIFEIEEAQNMSKKNKEQDQNILIESPDGDPENNKRFRHLVFINPIIVKQSKKKVLMEEGCLSVRWLYGLVERHQKTTVKAFNDDGLPFSFGGSGIMAQVFQHEIDHLDGILFIDKAKDLKNIPPVKS